MENYAKELEKRGTDRMKALRKVELTTDILKTTVRAAVASGMSQSEAARLAGVRRQTVIEWCAE
jgi:DNA-binding XRE family transcriptional regulator